MRVYRFMSDEEFKKYKKGEVLKNTINHNKERIKASSSIGFCFFDFEEYSPEIMSHSVSGIVSFDWCVVFEVKKDKLNRSQGRYAKQKKLKTNTDLINLLLGNNESFIANEYCTTEYSNKDLKLVKYAVPRWFTWDIAWDWREKNEN